jgi:four helix bundle protein
LTINDFRLENMNAAELKARTKQFALRVMKLVDALPKTASGRAVADQLIRAASSIGANYRAACRARSKAEFAAKLSIVVEEADECCYWLELIMEGGLLSADQVKDLHREAEEITAIMAASRKTVRTNQQN